MPLSQPNNPPLVNEAVAKPASSGLVIGVDENQTKINQIHGITSNNALGAGIPKQVTNVQVSITNAATGSTCTISVLFKQDPTDKNFSGVNIWVKGYQGNAQLVQVASGTSSPCKFVLNNTGEIVSFTIQAFGNGGNAPLNQAPTCSGTLPKSTAGGYGSSTVVSTTTVTSSSYPVLGGDDFPFDFNMAPIATGLSLQLTGPLFGSTASWANLASTIARVDSTTQPTGTKFTTGTGVAVSAQCFYADSGGHNPPLAIYGRIRFRLSIGQTTNSRMFFGLTDSVNGLNANASDNPNNNIIGFRYSSHAPDANWMMYCSTSNVAFTGKVASGSIDTGIHTFDVYYTASSVSFYIDGVLVGSITTNIPASSTLMGPFINITNVSGGAVSFTSWTIKGVIGKNYR